MSMRQAKKLMQKDDDLQAYKQALEEEKQMNKQSKQTSAFAGFTVDSSSEESEEDTPKIEKVQQPS
jgi:hypothetical protein